jgi:Putative beta-barrel porin 2
VFRAEKTDKEACLRKILSALCITLAALRGAPALAQAGDGGPDTSSARVRIGPLMMNPTISISNIGVDRNVFNDPPDKNPKQDFTVTFTPLSNFWLRLGPTWVTATLNESINWYQTYASERTASTGYKMGWSVPGSRMSFKVDGSYVNAHERPGFEIDTRAGRAETTFSGSLDVHALPKSYIGVSAARQQTRFADEAAYLGTSLRTSLNRVDTSYGANFRHQLTPLTTITFSATRANARFEFSRDRDTVSNSAAMSVAFQPAALLRGGFSVGYTDFEPVDRALPGFQGLIGSVDLTYVLLGSTRFSITGGRAVQYSYDFNQPYYLQSRVGASVAQQIFGPVDVQVRGDIADLSYRNRAGAVVTVPDRTDRVTTVGAGVGFHLGKDLRLSFNVDQSNRDTQVLDHQYEKLLIGSSLTYGF